MRQREKGEREKSFLKNYEFCFCWKDAVMVFPPETTNNPKFFFKKRIFYFLSKRKKFENFEARECCLKGKVVSG